jgi:hypothetical protein
MDDFYTITQALGKYNDNDSRSNHLPSLHPLLYASKSAYKGSKDRYSGEECRFPISKKEFENFVIEHNPQQFAIFVKQKIESQNAIKFDSLIITKKHTDAYLVKNNVAKSFYNKDLSVNQMGTMENYPVTLFKNGKLREVSGVLDKKDVFAIFTTATPWLQVSKFYSPDTEISFDIVTIYEILTNRASCTTIIKNYAKEMTLEIFNNYLTLLDQPTSIHALNIYLKTNAYILGIDESFYSTLLINLDYVSYYMRETVLKNYIDNTFDQRLNLISMIRESILSQD